MNTAIQGIQRIRLHLRGMDGSPLVVHAFAEKAKNEIRQRQQKRARKAKEQRDPSSESDAAKYVNAHGDECVPVTAIKKAIISAASAFDDITKVGLRQALFVQPALYPSDSLVPIMRNDGSSAVGTMREDAVTIGQGTRGLAYRPEYPEWNLLVDVEFNPRLVSEEQLLALVDQAGWGVGICEGRPEKSSALSWGRFRRQTDE
jgi:hypothetical protein